MKIKLRNEKDEWCQYNAIIPILNLYTLNLTIKRKIKCRDFAELTKVILTIYLPQRVIHTHNRREMKKLITTHYDTLVEKKEWPVKFSIKTDNKEDYYTSYQAAKLDFDHLKVPAALWQVDGMLELLILKEWEK